MARSSSRYIIWTSTTLFVYDGGMSASPDLPDATLRAAIGAQRVAVHSKCLADQTREALSAAMAPELGRDRLVPLGDVLDRLRSVNDYENARAPEGYAGLLEGVYGLLGLDAAEDSRLCPDRGTCHHGCTRGCFRVKFCAPLSGTFPGNRWPIAVLERHGRDIAYDDTMTGSIVDPDRTRRS